MNSTSPSSPTSAPAHSDSPRTPLQTTSSLADALFAPVRQRPTEKALVILTGDHPPLTLTYAQVWAAAQREAAHLLAAGISAGDRILLVGHHDPHLIQAWMGAVILGAIPAIFPYLPGKQPSEQGTSAALVQRALRFAIASDARALVTPAPWQATFATELHEAGATQCAVLELGAPVAPDVPLPALPPFVPAPDAPAYLQLSSGTTGDVKGSPIGHASLIEHVRQLQQWLALTPNDVVVGWLPFSHDLGLVSQVLVAWLTGYPSVLIAPEQWVRRPRLLLRAAHDYGATILIMPTFGYAHCTQHVRDEEMADVDLSPIRFCIVGAEVIPAATMHAFVQRFAPWGMRDSMILPAYGMAEAVNAVTMTPLGRGLRVDRVQREALQREGWARPVTVTTLTEQATPGETSGDFERDEPPDMLSWTSCGLPLPDTKLEIVNSAGMVLPERRVGRIIIHRAGLGAAMVGGDPTIATPGTVATRDIGYLADGELFVCGRQDDMMILGGANLYPEAIEMTALAAIGEGAGRAAAFGMRDRRLSTETAVLVCEVRGTLTEERQRELDAAVRRAVRAQHEILLGDLWFVRRGWIETSESGKVARQATQHKYRESGRMASLVFLPEIGHLSQVGPEQVGALAQALADRIALLLGRTGAGMGVSVHEDVLDLGLTSLTATAIMAQLRRERGKAVAIERWVEEPTCAHLAALLLDTPYVAPAPPPLPTVPPAEAAKVASAAPTALPATTSPVASKSTMPQLVTTLAAHPLREQNQTPEWLWRRIVGIGPHIERFNKLALPYGIGTQVQKAWLTQTWVRQRYFDAELALLAAWFGRVGRTLDEEIVLCNLMFNCWPHWRRRALDRAAVRARYLQIEGAETLAGAHRDGRGTVFAITHTPGRWMVLDWLLRENPQTTWISYSSQVQQAYRHSIVSQLYQAGETLQQGGNVLIATDGWHGEGGELVDLGYGVRRELYPGAAELAVRYQARLVPVEVRFGLDGVMQIEFKAAVQPVATVGNQAAERAEKENVDALHAAYVAYYRQQWPATLEYQSWNTLHTASVRMQQLAALQA